jgi:hypothetical protein
LPLDGDRKPVPYVPSAARQGHFSPDGHWVAYASVEAGTEEVFVEDFPRTGAKYQISTSGGSEPRWRRDNGRELFFMAPDGRIMAVEVETRPAFRPGVPKPLFQTRLMDLSGPSRRYGVRADGQRFLMNVAVNDKTFAPITIVLNWSEELKQRVPTR